MLPLLLLACWSTPPTCPPGMVLLPGVERPYCMHAYEVALEGPRGNKDQGFEWPDGSTRPTALYAEAGRVPSVLVSWYQAAAACQGQGWRLCTSAEWEDACDGQPGPGGAEHPTLDGTLAHGTCAIMEHDGRLAPHPAGAFPACRTPTGIHDLEGNVWEWTDPRQVDATGRPVVDKRGGGWYSGRSAPCAQAAVGTHAPSFDGSIGFRCCADPG